MLQSEARMATVCNKNICCYIASPFVLRFVTNCYIPSRCFIPWSIRAQCSASLRSIFHEYLLSQDAGKVWVTCTCREDCILPKLPLFYEYTCLCWVSTWVFVAYFDVCFPIVIKTIIHSFKHYKHFTFVLDVPRSYVPMQCNEAKH